MEIPGKRVKRTRLVQTSRFVVAVDVDAIIPTEDDSEVCYEPATVQHLREVERRAQQGDREWLLKHGTVYERVAA